MSMLVFLTALLGAASAAKYCCSPDQWQGNATIVMILTYNGTSHFIEGSMTVDFDEVNRIVAYNQTLTYDGNPLQQRIISDDKNNVMHIITPEGCRRSHPAPWRPSCIPDDAHEFTNTSVMGYGNNSILMKRFYERKNNYEVYLLVTADTCMPVLENYIGDLAAITGQAYQPTQAMESVTYVNIKAGISNRDVFSVPAQCSSGAMGQAVGRRSMILI